MHEKIRDLQRMDKKPEKNGKKEIKGIGNK